MRFLPRSSTVACEAGVGSGAEPRCNGRRTACRAADSRLRLLMAHRKRCAGRDSFKVEESDRYRYGVPIVSAGGSGGRSTKPACEGSTPSRDATVTGTARAARCAAGPHPFGCHKGRRTPQKTALARGSSAALPKRGFAVRVGTRAPQGRAMAAHWAHTPARQRTRFDSGSENGDNARCDAALIRPAAVVRVHVSPLRDRLAVGQLRFERRRRAFESCARNPRGTRRLVTAAGLHPAEKSSILLSRTARRAPVGSRGLYPRRPGSTPGRRTKHAA